MHSSQILSSNKIIAASGAEYWNINNLYQYALVRA